ncbi:hypothetical protein FQA39_LY06758 [Lamprigera yunnana]|nr:hypothetical protein FQA39_LY06758 [Lamprigera yunnana]
MALQARWGNGVPHLAPNENNFVLVCLPVVCDYKRTTDRGSWSEESMREAVQMVLDGKMGYYKAAKQFDVPQTTLERKVKAARTVLNEKSDENLPIPIKVPLDSMQALCKNHFLQQVYRKIDGALLWSQNERNLDCVVTFQTHSILQRFMLRFDFLQLDCNDHLYIYDGAHPVGTYKSDLTCKNTKQKLGVMFTNTNYVTLKYVTDGWGTDSNGFKLVITAVKDIREYGSFSKPKRNSGSINEAAEVNVLSCVMQNLSTSTRQIAMLTVTSQGRGKELKDCQTQRCVKPPKQVKKDLFAEVPTSSKNCTQNRKLSSKSVKKDARSSSSDSYDSDDICQGSDISDFICDEGDKLFEDSETKFTLDQKEICLNDFVSVSLKEIKKQVLNEFVGQIIGVVEEESNDSEVAYKVKFMRNYRQHTDIFQKLMMLVLYTPKK